MSDPASKHARGIATMTSRLMDFEGVFNSKNKTPTVEKVRECIKKMADWDTKGRWSFEKYIEELNSLKKSANPEDALKIEAIIQGGYQGDLENDFKSLVHPFPQFGKDGLENLIAALKSNTKLTIFIFPELNGIAQEAQNAINNTIKRNMLLPLLDQPVLEENLGKFLEIYKTMDPKYLSNPPINSKMLTDLVKSSIPKHVELIGSLPDPARRVLLEVCFQDQAEEGVKISKEELKNKALLVSMMFGSEAFLASKKLDDKPEEFLEWSFDYDTDHDYEDLKF